MDCGLQIEYGVAAGPPALAWAIMRNKANPGGAGRDGA
jgi:hypothetical protein